VAGLNSAGGMPQNEVPSSVNVEAWIGATSNLVRASSRLQLTMAFFRSATEEKDTDLLVAPFLLLLGSPSSWM
jgi:hypothetical protein